MRRLRGFLDGVPGRERWIVAAAMVVSFALVIAYVASNRFEPLVGDQPEYDLQGTFFTLGKWWWSTTPFDVAHASAWKAPAYPLWVGFWYELFGPSATRVEYVQALLAPLSVLLTWLLARRLFSATVAILSACVVAVFPLAWEFYGLLYPEALAIPLTLLALYLFLDREPTPRRAVSVGLVIGVGMLVRPTSVFLFAGLAVAWVLASGWRRGTAMTALAVAVAALAILPWTIRNYVVTDGGLIAISIQDAATYGTFNEIAANDPVYPYAWRATVLEPDDLIGPSGPPNDAELRTQLQARAFDYIREHPASVPKAFFWNGVTRLWDLRRPARALDEVAFEGRSRTVTAVGLAIYYLLLPLAIIGLWRLRRRRELLLPLLALALAASVVFTVASGTRYRAPLEPVIVILAATTVAGWLARRRRPRSPDPPAARREELHAEA